MIRQIDLKKYLPQFVVDYKELNAILDIENEYLNSIEGRHWRIIDNRFIQTCDAEGIARFESMLKIKPLANDTLNDRKFRVLSKWNRVLPYNYRYMYDQLTTLCGADGFKVELNDLTLTVWIALTSANMKLDVEKFLDEIVPCNVVLSVLLLYNQHLLLAQYKHEELSTMTHYELRNEDIANLFAERGGSNGN